MKHNEKKFVNQRILRINSTILSNLNIYFLHYNQWRTILITNREKWWRQENLSTDSTQVKKECRIKLTLKIVLVKPCKRFYKNEAKVSPKTRMFQKLTGIFLNFSPRKYWQKAIFPSKTFTTIHKFNTAQ